jgi:ubiquinone/menaquinone biosynthesis C-methylase UbiE
MHQPVQTNITDYYNQLAPCYDADRFGNTYGQYLHRQEWYFFQKLITPGTTPVLSLGCGTGRMMEMASHGADISPAMIEEASKKFLDKKFTVCNAAKTMYENGFFAGVFTLHVLMHLPSQTIENILAEASRITSQGGWLVVDFPNAERRTTNNSTIANWHANTIFTLSSFAAIADKYGWIVQKNYGLLLFPIHRIPKGIRKLIFWADVLLCHSFLKKYASYTLVKLVKK